ncbi:YbaB/EbfC family nucleoid-associated protein [Kibdelosporangium philippinense]|uniref:YbaB/EbfC family nucleoid-associated protein n=1 Tax=Kibdelosporangium philippinense TaxID=211113 RepID=A0ABS8ZN51_9PSEU|nr:YbaB/EbfC family nucleoid-associated protein [Kibdelosporangium philippinense]MCE7009195.1 YbaB/EbfC family nucleoid-associated protein [Kibdelosporangium philippinense]
MTEAINDWMAGFEARIAELQQKSATLQQNIAASGATATSPDGSVRVTVGPTGALENLQLAPSTTRYPPAELAGIIMRAAAEAQREAAHRVAQAFAPVAEGTDAMRMLQEFLPPPPEHISDAPVDGLAGVDDIDEPPPPPAQPAPPVAPPPRPTRRPSTQDDDDFEQPW